MISDSEMIRFEGTTVDNVFSRSNRCRVKINIPLAEKFLVKKLKKYIKNQLSSSFIYSLCLPSIELSRYL